MNIQEIRAKYPQYGDLSDDQLGKALHAKFYADMPFDDFAQKVGLSVKAKAESPITGAEELAGNPVTRFALGAASPFLGAAQLGAEALGDKSGTETLGRVEELKRTGMKAMGGEGVDVAGIAGTVASPAFLGVAKALPAVPTVAGKVAQGAAVGAVAGATAPVSDAGADYWTTKGGQTILGLAAGALIPGGIEAGKGVARGGRDIADMFTERGAGRILTRYQQRIIGENQGPA